jgi:hypothetical protein
MKDLITLSCPSCGNKLQITSDIDRFACAACGNEYIVNRSDGIVSVKPVIDNLTKGLDEVDRTDSEIAIVRLNKEIDELEKARRNVPPKMIADKSKPKNMGYITIVCIIGIITVSISGVSSSAIGFIVGLLFCGLGILFLVYSLKQARKADESMAERTKIAYTEIDDELLRIDALIESKEKELAAHKYTVANHNLPYPLV